MRRSCSRDSGYHGEKLRWLTSKDFYQEHYLPALTAQQQLADIGINTDLEVMPAATYIQTRSDPGKFDMFSSFLPTYVDPVVIPYLNKTYPGFWADPAEGGTGQEARARRLTSRTRRQSGTTFRS